MGKVVRDPQAGKRYVTILKPVGSTCAWCLWLADETFGRDNPPLRGHANCNCIPTLVPIGSDGKPESSGRWSWLAVLFAIVAKAREAARNDPDPKHDEAWYIRELSPEAVSDGHQPPPDEPPASPTPEDDGIPRPAAAIMSAIHSMERHAHDAPDKKDTTYFPPGWFGEDEDDDAFALWMINEVVQNGTPTPDDDGYLFRLEINGVMVVVPVRPKVDNPNDWETRTAYPESGRGVTVFANGQRWPVG